MRQTLTRIVLALGTLLVLGATVVSCAPSMFAGEAYQRIAPTGRFHGTVALFVSGDAGMRFGMGRPVTLALAGIGIPVIGISSPVAFADTHSRTAVDAVVIAGVRRALAVPGTKRVVLIGQSFGADLLSTTAPDLPQDLRAKVAAIVLVVPARATFFRADPLGLAYHAAPDAHPAAAMRGLRWAPVTCIQGVQEEDSLCPLIDGVPATRIVMPGGHFLRHDDAGLIRVILRQLARDHAT
ncbi:AcvB/VirJ family lysyl-phosphatidylglycerol hydrolase [Sphingomonas sp. RS2018]